MPRIARPVHPAPTGATVLIAVDGGSRLGFGHAGRCVAIWEELGQNAAFHAADTAVAEYLRRRGATVFTSDLAGHPAPVVVLDRAGPVEAEEIESLHRAGSRVALIDDPGPGRALADLVVDPPTGASWPATAGRRLAGFEHALVRREIREQAGATRRTADVLVSLGGSDPGSLTPSIMAALSRAGVDVKAVLGPGYSGPVLDPSRRLEQSDWPAALAGAGLLVTRFGHTLLEAAHLGVPAIALATGPREEVDAQAFAAHGSARALGADALPALVKLVGDLKADRRAMAELTQAGPRLVDGLGARRVADALTELAL